MANEATAVDFPLQTLRRMREQSCNGLVINNALVSRPRNGEGRREAKGEGKKDRGIGREREREKENIRRHRARDRFVLVEDVAGLVH